MSLSNWRFALGLLVHRPAFTAVAVLALDLAAGAPPITGWIVALVQRQLPALADTGPDTGVRGVAGQSGSDPIAASCRR